MVAAGQTNYSSSWKSQGIRKPLVVVTMYKRSMNSTWKQLTVQQQVKAETKLQFIETHISLTNDNPELKTLINERASAMFHKREPGELVFIHLKVDKPGQNKKQILNMLENNSPPQTATQSD